jgi:hypothetical protein
LWPEKVAWRLPVWQSLVLGGRAGRTLFHAVNIERSLENAKADVYHTGYALKAVFAHRASLKTSRYQVY